MPNEAGGCVQSAALGKRKEGFTCGKTCKEFAFLTDTEWLVTCYDTYWVGTKATPATPDNTPTFLDTFMKERFRIFPHKHADTTTKPKNRDETCISCFQIDASCGNVTKGLRLPRNVHFAAI